MPLRKQQFLHNSAFVAATVLFVCLFLTPTLASAGPNDFVLSRFSTWNTNSGCPNACGTVQKQSSKFRRLAIDTAQVFAPRFNNPSDTLGEAGFSANVLTSVSFIPSNKQHWQQGVEDRSPPSALSTMHIQMRKGLPASIEFGGNMTYLTSSEMFGIGSYLKWAFVEGYRNFPDLALRATLNTLAGSRDLNMFTAGGDFGISHDFGIGGVVELAPYAGYQRLYVIASSRILSAYPEDPRPPQKGSVEDGTNTTFSPEFVFSDIARPINRGYLGARVNTGIASFALEGVAGSTVQQLTLSAGFEF